MTDRADALEARIQQLEMENKWLRNLVVEKTASGWKSTSGEGEGDVKALWEKFEREKSSSASSSSSSTSSSSSGAKEAKGAGTGTGEEGKEAKKEVKEKA